MPLKKLAKKILLKRGWINTYNTNLCSLVAKPNIALPRLSEDPTDLSIQGRLGLPWIIKENARCLELGVAAGYFSEAILMSSQVSKLFSIDCWADHHDDSEYIRACARLSSFGTRSVVMRSFFDDILNLFPDGYFDFIYIDAYAHTGQQNGKLFHDWYPKLKVGGLFSGHDYDTEKWQPTVAAVDNFAKIHGKKINIAPAISTQNEEDKYPSWYFWK